MHFEGVYTAVVTPFTDSDKVDTAALATLVEHIVNGGGEGIVALGTTGEGYAVDDDERRVVLSAVAEAAGGRAGLIAGATASTTRDAVANTILARELNYTAAMIAPPPYVLPTAGELTAHYREIARQAQLPILLYDFPARVGVSIGWDVLDALAEVPEVIGLKEASGDLTRIVEMQMRYGDRFEIVCGADPLIVDFALWGARGWIAGASGFLPKQHSEILRLASSGAYVEAKRKLEELLPMLLDMEHSGYGHKVRSGLATYGLPAGHARHPMQPLSDADRDQFTATLPSNTLPPSRD